MVDIGGLENMVQEARTETHQPRRNELAAKITSGQKTLF